MYVCVCVYGTVRSNVQKIKFNVEYWVGIYWWDDQFCQVFSTGVVFSRIFHSHATQSTKYVCMYIDCTPYTYVGVTTRTTL